MSVVSASSSFKDNNSQISTQIVPHHDAHHHDEDDEADLNDEHQTFMSGVFGVIYTVSRERTVSWKFVAFKCVLDAWQLLALTINPNYGWTIRQDTTWWYCLDFIQLQTFIQQRGLTFFLAFLYIFEVLLLAVVLVCVWVAWSFKNKRFDSVWPITFLRWFGVIFFQMLDVASMNLILMTMDTSYFGVDASQLYYHNEFPGLYILSMPYFIHVVISAICLLAFTVLSALFSMGEMELNPVSKNMLAMAHTRVEVLSFLMKFVMTSSSVFLQNNDNRWLSVVYVVASGYLVFLNVKWVPCYYAWMNYIRCGTYGAVFYSACLMVLLVFMPGVDPSDLDAVASFQRSLTLALVIGLLPVAALFVGFAWLRMRHFLVTVVDKFRRAPAGVKSTEVHVFTQPLEVEIAARCCRKWVKPELLDDKAVDLAGVVLEAGMQQLAGQAYMYILHSSYHIDVQGGFQTGLMELKAAKKADPSFLERFAIFSREQQLTQKAAGGAKGSKGEDLVSYVEQQHDYRLAVKVHKEALLATSAFWKSLMHPEVKLRTLTQAVSAFDVAVKHADIMYRNMLQRHPEDWRLLRMYAKFVEFIKNDPWSSAKWNAEADRLWEEEEDDKHNLFNIKTLANKDAAMHELVQYTMEDSSKGVIIMNAQCIVAFVNKPACQMFGYDVRGLRGHNVNMLIPSPFAEQHDSWVRDYTSSERSAKPLERTANWVALHKDGYVFGVKLWFCKISGSGMDSMFLGTIEPLPVSPNVAHTWVLGSGVLVSTDNVFSDWFGYHADDLRGVDMASLIVEENLLQEALRPGLEKDNAKYHQAGKPGSGLDASHHDTSVTIDAMHIKHKYAGPVACSLTVMYGGVGQHHLFILHIKRSRQAQLPMIVADSKGKVVHASKSIATALGYTLPQVEEELAAKLWDAIIPEPFSQLHRVHVNQDLLNKTMPSPYSCRSGLSVCLLASTPQGPQIRPFKLRVNARRRDEGDVCNIVTFEKSTMDQALNERRLSLIVDESGLIRAAGNSPKSLFGFDPQQLIGRPIAHIVDVFNTGSDDQPSDNLDIFGHTQEILVELTKMCLESPGASFRVGVSAPIQRVSEAHDSTGANGAHPATGRRTSVLMDTVTSHMHHKGIRAAVMQVKLHLPGELEEPGGGSPKPQSVPTTPRKPKKGGWEQEVASASSEPEVVPASAVGAGVEAEAAAGLRCPAEVARSGSGILGVQMEVLLWRADLLTGVLQLDAEGRVVSTSDVPLFDPGLLLGLPSEALVGRHVQELLPGMEGHKCADLFLPDLEGKGEPGNKRGGLKKERGSRKDRKPGPVNVLQGVHLVEGQNMELMVQAAYSWVKKSNVHLVLHAPKPACGMPCFKDWLRDNPHAGRGPPPLPTPQQLLSPPPETVAHRGSGLAGLPAGSPGSGSSSMQLTAHLARRSVDLHGLLPPQPAAAASGRRRSEGDGAFDAAASLRGAVPPVSTDGMHPSQRLFGSMHLTTPPVGTHHPRFMASQVAGHEGGSHAALHSPTPAQQSEQQVAAAAESSPANSKKRMLHNSGASPLGPEANQGELGYTLDTLLEDLANDEKDAVAAAAAAAQEAADRHPLVPPAKASLEAAGSIEMPRVAEWVYNGGQVSVSGPPPVDKGRQDAVLRHVSTVSSVERIDDGEGSNRGMGGAAREEEGRERRVARDARRRSAEGKAPEEESESGSGSRSEGDEEEETASRPLALAPTNSNMQLLVKDAIGALGANRKSPSEDGDQDDKKSDASGDSAGTSDASGAPGAGVDESDYRRGQRFKRVARLLLGETTKSHIRSFKLKGWGAAAFACCVSLACFVTMYVLLQQQQAGVANLNTIGFAATKVTNVYLTMVDVNTLFQGQGQPNLPLLTNASDLPYQLSLLTSEANDFQTSMSTSYFKIMSLRGAQDLQTIWNTPFLNITKYFDSPSGNGTIMANTTLMSLWDAAGLYTRSALHIASTAYSINTSAYASGTQWRGTKEGQIITTNMVTILGAIFTTLDDLLEVVVAGTNSMNQVQYIFLAIEGVLCSVLACLWMFVAATTINVQRWNMYNVFMVVPTGLLKGLASKTLTLDEQDADHAMMDHHLQHLNNLQAGGEAAHHAAGGSDAARVQYAGGESGDGEGSHHRHHSHGGHINGPGSGNASGAKLNFAGSVDVANDSLWVAIKDFLKSARHCFRRPGSVAPGGSKGAGSHPHKRHLTRSHHTAMLFSAPFLAWGIMMMSINGAGHAELSAVSGPIALFNIVNFVIAFFYRNFSLMQDMTTTAAGAAKEALRAKALSLFLLPMEYKAMVLGASAVPGQTSPHFTLATSGVAFTGSAGPDLLYSTHACLRADTSTCLTPDSPLYSYVSNGLDQLMNQYIYVVQDMLGMTGANPSLTSYEFYFMWNTKPDIEGGLIQLNTLYYAYVDSVYSGCLTIHIIGLVLTFLIMACFVWFMLRPYLTEITNETRRIAELLNQLPTEVDVESMVRRTQLDHSHPHHPSNADHTGQAIGGASGAGAVSGKVAGPPEASAASSKFDVLKDRNASFANYLKGR